METNNNIHEFTESKKQEKVFLQRIKKIEQIALENQRKINIIEKSLKGRK